MVTNDKDGSGSQAGSGVRGGELGGAARQCWARPEQYCQEAWQAGAALRSLQEDCGKVGELKFWRQ